LKPDRPHTHRPISPCPGCHTLAHVMTVPSAYHAGRQVTTVRQKHLLSGVYLITTRGTAVTVNALSRHLAPPRRGRRAARRAWTLARYCRTCRTVYFPATAAGLGVPIGHPITPARLAATLPRR
jgi:hypothetical protein